MILEIPISQSSREYGYVFWNSAQDEEVKQFFGDLNKVKLWLNGEYVGEKRIDWKARRIYLGISRTRQLDSEASIFRLEFDRNMAVLATAR